MSQQLDFDGYRERRGRRTAEVVSLDSWPLPGSRPPRARRTDADSSHRAADEAERSGRIGKQMHRVLVLVEQHPGRTAREIAASEAPPFGMDAGSWLHATGRRLSDLYRRGLVKRSGDPGLPVRERGSDFRWWPAEYVAEVEP